MLHPNPQPQSSCLTWTVTQTEAWGGIERLEMLRLAWRRRNSRLLCAKQRINGGGLAYIWVPDQPHHRSAARL